MGQTLLGGSERKENIDLLSPQQQNFLSGVLGQNAGLGANAYSEFLQPSSPAGYEDIFQKSVVDPSLKALQQQIIPGIKEGFLGLDESGSGSLNRALAQAATDVSTNLGSQYLNFFNQQNQNKLGALGQLGGLTGLRTFEPHIEQKEGILGPLLGALGSIGGGFLGGGGIGALGSLLGGSGGSQIANAGR